ncbi:hypothetical protein DFS34DRAFT_649034 [Phlyctochytrium arcticum]|nr:hypothetical protein DFS34DRAFT_649034 [Phlyctochytrium arcticum]
MQTRTWGIHLEPGRLYRKLLKRNLHITFAALGAQQPPHPGNSALIISFGERDVDVCSLTPGSREQLPLDLQYQKGDYIVISAKGNCSIDVTGISLLSQQETNNAGFMVSQQGGMSAKRKRDTLPAANDARKRARRVATPTVLPCNKHEPRPTLNEQARPIWRY